MTTGKFASPKSSSALAPNAFGISYHQPNLLSLTSPALAVGSAYSVALEAQMRFPWSGGFHPWLDVSVTSDDFLIGIESKRYEPFRDRMSVSISAAYSRPVWRNAMNSIEAMRGELQQGRTFQFLVTAQLVKDAFGLRTQAQTQGIKAILLYLYSEPMAYPDGCPILPSDIAGHREEVAAFNRDLNAVKKEVQFCSLTYSGPISHWSSDRALVSHPKALERRFQF